jgi:hypothetical protein
VAELEGNVEKPRMMWSLITWACQRFEKNVLFFITVRHRTCLSELRMWTRTSFLELCYFNSSLSQLGGIWPILSQIRDAGHIS